MIRAGRVNAHASLLAVVASVSVAGCERAEPPTARGIAVKVATPERASSASSTRYSAQILPQTRLDLAFKVGGYVETILTITGPDGHARVVQEGDQITAGAELASVKAVDYAQKVAEARAGVAQARSAYTQASVEYARDVKLVRRGSLPAAALDASRGRLGGAKGALDGAKVRLAQANTALDDATLVSPMDGVLLKRTIEVGALVTPGTIAFSIADVSSVKAVFGVPDVFLSRIEIGAIQKVTTDAHPGVEFEGRVTRLAPSADAKSRVFEVDVTIPNTENQLKAGMVAALSIDKVSKPVVDDAVLVPLTAIVRDDGGKGFAVFVTKPVEGGHIARAQPVELGEYSGRLIPVTKGLTGDERVVIQGAGLLSDGEPVEVIP